MSENVDQVLGITPAGGQNVAQQCPKCGKPNTGGGRYCLDCGNDLAITPSAPVQTTAPSPVQPTVASAGGIQRVVVTDFNMSFGSMVVFLIKLALAAIPALLVLLFIFFILSLIFGGVLGGLMLF